MVFGLDPEDGNDRDAVLSGSSSRQLNGGDGLEHGVERASEGPGLLPGDDSDGAVVLERGGGGKRFRRGAAAHELRAQQRRERFALPRVLTAASDRVAPAIRPQWIARVKCGERIEVAGILSGERPDPRDLPNVDTDLRIGGQGARTLSDCVTFFQPRLEELRKLTRDDPSAFAPPPAFGPFRVLHQVGVGALGPVFRTYEPTRDRLVAVKVFRLDVTPEQAQALADELSIAAEAGLFHPSVVEPIAAGVEGTVAYRAEEYVAAETLDVALRHYAPAPIDKVLPLIAQLAGAIDFARTAGVGHGALHPRDVFVTPEEVRATGFGVVEALERVGLRAPVRRPYSAPERVSGGTWSTPADVFSLAAIAYELLTGRRPAGTGSQIGTVSGTSAGAHPGELHAVFVRAMADDPSRRYQSAMGFASALDAAARGVSPTATHELECRRRCAVCTRGRAVCGHAVCGHGSRGACACSHPDARRDRRRSRVRTRGRNVPEGEELEDDEHGRTDDVLAEKEDDEAHASLLRYEADADVEIPDESSLFDAEALEDLSIDVPAATETDRFADEFSAAVSGPARHDRTAGRRPADGRRAEIEEVEDHGYAPPVRSHAGGTLFGHVDVDDSAAPAYMPASADDGRLHEDMLHDRPRPALWTYALTLVAGLLIGALAVGWFMRRFEPAEPGGTPATAARDAGALQ